MELFEIILGFVSGGGIVALLTIGSTRRKASAEAFMSLQDVYQRAVDDMNKRIEGLCEDRDHLRQDRDELRTMNDELRKLNDELRARQNSVDDKVRELEEQVAENKKMVEAMIPITCIRTGCMERLRLTGMPSDFLDNVGNEAQKGVKKETKKG